jgi:DNA invertase Pin-like site-specific DNA recombinase
MTRAVIEKVTASHLRRDAHVYVRQATVQQGFENSESCRRQYALCERAMALGWPVERVHVIDSDLGRSGASSADCEGLQKLVSEIDSSRAGIVLAMDVSRLTRSSSDWQRLLESCALTDTLLFVEERLYGPGDLSDRLVLVGHSATAGTQRRGDLREVPA